MKIRYDAEGDFIEVVLKDRKGTLRKTNSPYIMEKIDDDKNVIGFSILRVSTLKKQGHNIDLVNVATPAMDEFKLWYQRLQSQIPGGDMQRIAEVIEANTTEFVAQCYELYQLPPLGSLVKTIDTPVELYGIVYNATTASIEPGRRPIARGKDEKDEAAIYQSNPQLSKLLRSEFTALVVGHRQSNKLYHYLPPTPARIHGFVYLCPMEEVREFSQSLAFLNILLRSNLPVSVEELTGASLRQMSQAYDDRHAFLLAAGKELAVMLGRDFNRLKAILEKIGPVR
jgi:hypothetical protein